jgi:hypothetical protein
VTVEVRVFKPVALASDNDWAAIRGGDGLRISRRLRVRISFTSNEVRKEIGIFILVSPLLSVLSVRPIHLEREFIPEKKSFVFLITYT